MAKSGQVAPESSSLSSSLLERVRQHDTEAWRRLVAIYSPLVYRWCRRSKLQPSDAMDVLQEVFRAVATAIGSFRRDRAGDSFGGWLRTITRNKLRDYFRSRARQPQAAGGSEAQKRLEEAAAFDSADLPESAADSDGVVHRAVEAVRAEFEPKTWSAFWRTTVDDESAADVAESLQMTLGAVYKAKSRVLARLRAELEGLAD
jgi:RNA polymerase sigma-70 factor (ECF subfamily)